MPTRRKFVFHRMSRRSPSRLIAAVCGAFMATFFTTSCAQPQTEPSQTAPAEVALDTDIRKGSYQVGFNMARQLNGQFSGALDEQAFMAGVADLLAGQDSRVDPAEAQASLQALLTEQRLLADQAAAAEAEAGAAYLAKNAERDEVTALPSGLQYEVLTMGKGAKPAATDRVTTHYEGRLLDGTVFDSSYARGEPVAFPLDGVISGWTEGLQLMPTGSKWRLYVPANLGYGARGAPPSIPPNATLIFDVELLSIGE